jgi:outer membrane protein TolC
MLDATLGPGSFGSNKVDFAYRLELSQKYPFPGKLRLRGENADALASAAGHEVEDTRLQLIEAAKHAFSDYYLADRALAVNKQALQLLHEFRDNAASRYRVGQAPEQDVLQADVEIGRQEERHLTLETRRQVAIARINTLLHLSPDNALPYPPEEIPIDQDLPGAPELRALALARRPDLQAVADRIKAEQAALALAYKESCPDFDVMAAYDSFWQEKELRPMVGVRLNLPIRTARRYGAISEADARIAQRRAELARLTDEVNFEVQEAYEQVRKSQRIVELYRKTTLQAAQANVKSAQSAYVNAKFPFLNLIDAERNLVDLQDRYYEAVADYFRRRATLERVVGGPLARNP